MERIKLAPKRKRPRRVARKIERRWGLMHYRDHRPMTVDDFISLPYGREAARGMADRLRALLGASDYDVSHGVPWLDHVMRRGE
jgi:hypothetical protein